MSYARLSRIRTALIVVNAEAGVFVGVVYKIVVGNPQKTDSVLDVGSEIIGGEFGDHTGVQSEERHSGHDIQFCTAGFLFKSISSYQTFVDGR